MCACVYTCIYGASSNLKSFGPCLRPDRGTDGDVDVEDGVRGTAFQGVACA